MTKRKAELIDLRAKCAALERALTEQKARAQPQAPATEPKRKEKEGTDCPRPVAPPVLPKGRAVYRDCRASTLEEAAEMARAYFSGCGPND